MTIIYTKFLTADKQLSLLLPNRIINGGSHVYMFTILGKSYVRNKPTLSII